MAGTGIKGFTGTSADGKYNIVNGTIVSQNPSYSTPATTSGGYAIANRNGAVMDTATSSGLNASDLALNIGQAVANAFSNMNPGQSVEYAKAMENLVSSSNSDYADMIREILANQDANTAKSQAFAREQMDYQTRSDKAAMAWSAQEAQKNRDWQEKLSDQAHQREVKDLLAAGLNPILSANQGAFTGSGATGQGFSSSGAMGQVDMSANTALGTLYSTVMNTASQAEIARIYTDAERYNADLQYSASKMATEASIMNNQNTNSASKEIAYAGLRNDLEKAEISGRYGLASAQANAAGMTGSAAISAQGARDVAELNKEKDIALERARQSGMTNRQIRELNQQWNELIYKTENGSVTTVGGAKGIAKTMLEDGQDLLKDLGVKVSGRVHDANPNLY